MAGDGGRLSNNRMQVTVCAVTARAENARSAPAQPAPDAARSTDIEAECAQY